MARRYEQITELYRQSIREITSRPENWTSFLRSACRNYRLPFDELVLIYAQRPDATAVLPIEGKNGWNKRFGRWVNRGATGIAVFDREYVHGTRLKYYFDISDTHESRFARPIPLWEVQSGQEADVIESLENRFGELESKENLAAALLSTAKNAVEDNMPDYLSDLLISREGSFLEELDDLNVEVAYRNALQASVGYIFLTRCGLNADEYLGREDFAPLLNFNTPETVNAIGVATRDIAEIGLAEISRTVRNLQRAGKNTNRTFAETAKARYAENTERTNQPERSAEHGTDIYQSGRLPSAESGSTGTAAGTLGQIRLAPTFVSEGTPQDSVHEYELFDRVSCWCCPLQGLKGLRSLYEHFPDLWKQLQVWDESTWRQFRKDYSVRELAWRFEFEKEWEARGGKLRTRAFFSALKEELAQRRLEVR